jgi:atypical dual specificity phosphatase
MSKIMEGLYLGSWKEAKNINWLKKNKITHILCAAAELGKPFPGEFIYKHIFGRDVPGFNLYRYFDEIADFI